MNLFITGDFCPIHRADVSFKKSSNFLSDDFRTLIESADFAITNLECPLTTHKTQISKTGPALKADPKNISFLKDNKFNLVTLANNHIMDYGSEGLKETLINLENNRIGHIGAGKSSDEIDVVYKTKGDVTIAIINVCENEWSTQERDGYQAYGFSEIDIFYSIKKAKAKADKVIVIHHGGHEMYPLPSPRLKKTLRFLVDCGANAVINHHTHCIGGVEVYKQSPIFYSLGNFVFDNPQKRNSIWNFGMAATLSCNKENIIFQNHYFEQFNDEAKVNLIEKEKLLYDVDKLKSTIFDDYKLEQKFEEFILKQKRLYLSYLEPVRSKYLLALINRGLLPSLWNKKKRKYLTNIVRCESHREILEKVLSNEISNT